MLHTSQTAIMLIMLYTLDCAMNLLTVTLVSILMHIMYLVQIHTYKSSYSMVLYTWQP